MKRILGALLLSILSLVLAKPGSAVAAEVNSAALLMNGDDIARATLEMIAAAKQEVISVEFLMRQDEFSLFKMAALRAKARQGVRVIMQVDALHMMVEPAMIYHLQQEGIQVLLYNAFEWKNFFSVDSRDHSKLLVVDGSMMKTGDTNTGNEYVRFGDGHKMQSRDIFLTGPIARKARHYALQMTESDLATEPRLSLETPEKLAQQKASVERRKKWLQKIFKFLGVIIDAPDVLTKPRVDFFTPGQLSAAQAQLDQAEKAYENLRQQKNWHKPLEWLEEFKIPVEKATFLHDPVGKKGKSPGMDRSVSQMIERAQGSLTIVSPYLVIPQEEMAALVRAIARGVKVQIYTNSETSSDNGMTQASYEMRFSEIAQKLAGAEIYEYMGTDTWHAKMMLADGRHLIVMGYNMDYRSKKLNMETGQYVQSEALVRQMTNRLDLDREQFLLVAQNGKILPAKKTANSCSQIFISGGLSSTFMKKTMLKAIESRL